MTVPSTPASHLPWLAELAASGEPLFTDDLRDDFRAKWDRIQAGFVDEPRRAVEKADELVALTIERLAESFRQERNRVEERCESDRAGTEDLRLLLREYRALFQRLLAL